MLQDYFPQQQHVKTSIFFQILSNLVDFRTFLVLRRSLLIFKHMHTPWEYFNESTLKLCSTADMVEGNTALKNSEAQSIRSWLRLESDSSWKQKLYWAVVFPKMIA